MDETLKHEVAKYIYPFIGNTVYHNEMYLNTLFKKYGKKTVLAALKEEREKGSIHDAFSY